MENWIILEIQAGFRGLYSLKLKNSPSSNQIAKTVETWGYSINRRIGKNCIEQVDAPRIRLAFDYLVDNCEWWPSPKMLYDAMPSRPEQHFQFQR